MGISSRSAGFRFADEEYGLMDKLKFHFWPLFPTRKAILSAALRTFGDAVFMERTFAEAITRCQRALCAQRESSQMQFRFPATVELRPRFGKARHV